MHRVKRIVARTSLITLGLAAAQGIYIRRQFTQVEAPLGAHTGYESWMDNMKRVKRELEHQRDVCANKVMEKVAHIIEAKPSVLPSGITTDKSPSDSPDSDSVGLSLIDRIKMYFSSMRVIHGPRSDDLTPADSESSGKQRRKIKLILLGDSLVCGIGCDRELVLPNVIAKTLSLALQADVQWKAQGINGGTSLQLKSLLPHISEDLRSRSDANEEVLVVVICGLNDWKSVLLRFPFGSGPVQFKKNLDSLLSEIRELSGGACRVYLPALPIVCGDRDPKAILKTKPLKYFVEFFCRTWDMQKQQLAETSEQNVTFISEPDISAVYATPGEGNVCDDGVHPSCQGYEWWALHICESMIRTLKSDVK